MSMLSSETPYWKRVTDDKYALFFRVSRIWPFKDATRDSQLVAIYEPHDIERAANLELYLTDRPDVLKQPKGTRSYTTSQSRRLPFFEMERATEESKAMKLEAMVKRLAAVGVEPVQLWNAERGEVKAVYLDGFTVLLGQKVEKFGVTTNYVVTDAARALIDPIPRPKKPEQVKPAVGSAPTGPPQVITAYMGNNQPPQTYVPAPASAAPAQPVVPPAPAPVQAIPAPTPQPLAPAVSNQVPMPVQNASVPSAPPVSPSVEFFDAIVIPEVVLRDVDKPKDIAGPQDLEW